jgi:hypothetical protein
MFDIHIPRNLTEAQIKTLEAIEYGASITVVEHENERVAYINEDDSKPKRLNFKIFERLFEAELIRKVDQGDNFEIYK